MQGFKNSLKNRKKYSLDIKNRGVKGFFFFELSQIGFLLLKEGFKENKQNLLK